MWCASQESCQQRSNTDVLIFFFDDSPRFSIEVGPRYALTLGFVKKERNK